MLGSYRLLVLTLFAVIISMSLASAMPVDDVTLDGYVNDYAGVLSENETVALTSLMESLHENGTAQMSIVTVDSLEGMSKEQYAMEIAHENLGDKESDNGLLLLVAVKERKYRVEVGYGLEGVMTDAKTGQLAREYMVPYLKNDKYGQGLMAFTKQVYVELTGDEEFSGVTSPVSLQQHPQPPWWTQLGLLPFIVAFFIFRGVIGAIASRAGKKSSARRDNTDETFSAALLASMFLRGGGGGLGGAGGGLGGFGGGGFGGGGAGGGF